MVTVNNYRYHIYAVQEDGTEELKAWYNDLKSAQKELQFLRKRGYNVVIKDRLFD